MIGFVQEFLNSVDEVDYKLLQLPTNIKKESFDVSHCSNEFFKQAAYEYANKINYDNMEKIKWH